MSESSEHESHDTVDRMEEREILWKLFIAGQDCSGCPFRKSFSPIKTSACLRCFEAYLKRKESQTGS